MDILEIEQNILSNLDNLDNLLNEYEKLCGKSNKITDPINWIKKKFFLKKIITGIHCLNDNIWLIVKIQIDHVSKLIGNGLSDINTNIDIIVDKLMNIAPKYSILRIKYNKNDKINNEWYFIQYLLMDQDKLTEHYNEKYAKDVPEYQIKSILAEIKKKCKMKGIDYDMFLTRFNLLKEDITRGRIPGTDVSRISDTGGSCHAGYLRS
jgi:hypothetical protein